jgi:DNA-binding response OmpR family regulator
MGKRILLLDDDPMMLRAAARALEPHGIEVDGCEHVADFMRAARTGKHDALLIDWCLRKCEGTDVCTQLRKEGEERPIGLVSGQLDLEHGRDIAEAAGANCYIDKATLHHNLVEAVRKLLQSADKRQRRVAAEKTFRCALREAGTVLSLELRGGHVILSNIVVRLRPKELELFEALLQRRGQVVSKDELARIVWGLRSTVRTSIVETWVSRLRTALGPAGGIIETVRGGYTIATESGATPGMQAP